MLMCTQNLFYKFYPFILKIVSGNKILTSIKGTNSVANLQKMMHNNPNLDLVNVNVPLCTCTQNLVTFSPFILGNKILTSIKGCNSVANLQMQMTGNNSNLDLFNVDVHTKFGQSMSIWFSRYYETKLGRNDRQTDGWTG